MCTFIIEILSVLVDGPQRVFSANQGTIIASVTKKLYGVEIESGKIDEIINRGKATRSLIVNDKESPTEITPACSIDSVRGKEKII